jgi:hypothetical protein
VGRQGRGDFPTVDSVPPDGNRDWPGQYVDVRAAPRSTFKIIQLARRDAVQTAVPMKSQTHNIQIARFLICLPRTNGGFCSLFFLNETDLPSWNACIWKPQDLKHSFDFFTCKNDLHQYSCF